MDYKTEKGYLCDTLEASNFTNKKWCKINENDVNNNSLVLGMPNKTNGYYWDYIAEKNKEPVCMINEPNATPNYKKCTTFDKINYLTNLFSFFFIMTITPPVLGFSHFSQTMGLINKPDISILKFIFNKFKEELKKNNVSQSDIALISDKLVNELNGIDQNNKAELGRFIKNIFTISKNMTNETFPQMTQHSSSVISFLIKHVPDENMFDALKGANFVIEDNGELYEYAQNEMNGYGRFSSHAKNATDVIQLGVTDLYADVYIHGLFGKFKYTNGATVSWFQLEGAPMPPGLTTGEVFTNILSNGINFNYLQQYIDHFVDSEVYFLNKAFITLTGQKVAANLAIGTSPHTDTNPIYLSGFNFEKEVQPIIPYEMTNKNLMYTPLQNSFISSINLHNAISKNDSIYNNNYSQPLFANNNITNPTNNATNNFVYQKYLPQPSPVAHLGFQPAKGLLIGRGGKYKKTKNKRKISKRKIRRNKKTMTKRRTK
jgi:hypothetical protein